MKFRQLAKYLGWAIGAGVGIWILSIIASLGSWWVSLGIVALVALIAVVNRKTPGRQRRVGQPDPERRVISTDQDRWGGGSF